MQAIFSFLSDAIPFTNAFCQFENPFGQAAIMREGVDDVDRMERIHASYLMVRYFRYPNSQIFKQEIMKQNGTTLGWYYADWLLARQENKVDIEFIRQCVREVKEDLDTNNKARIQCGDEKFYEHYFFRRVFSREILSVMNKTPSEKSPISFPITSFDPPLLPMYKQAISNLQERLERDKASENGKFLKHFVCLPNIENKMYWDGLKTMIKMQILIQVVALLYNEFCGWYKGNVVEMPPIDIKCTP